MFRRLRYTWTLLSADITGMFRAGETTEFTFDNLTPSVAMSSPCQFFKLYAVKGEGTGECDHEDPVIIDLGDGMQVIQKFHDEFFGDIFALVEEDGTLVDPPSFWYDVPGNPTKIYHDTFGWTTDIPDFGINGSQHIISGSAVGDNSDWMAVAKRNDFYLIVRMNRLPVGAIEYGSNSVYATSYAKEAIVSWWDGDTAGDYAHLENAQFNKAGLKANIVPSNANIIFGTSGFVSSIDDGMSFPQRGSYLYPFIPSTAESAKFFGIRWGVIQNNAYVYQTFGMSAFANNNWQTLAANGDWSVGGGSYNAWMRSRNFNSTVGIYGQVSQITFTGNVGLRIPYNGNSRSIRPAMWVKADIFNLQ